MQGTGVQGLGCRVQGVGCRVRGLEGLGSGVQGLGFRVWGSGFGVQGLGFRVWRSRFGRREHYAGTAVCVSCPCPPCPVGCTRSLTYIVSSNQMQDAQGVVRGLLQSLVAARRGHLQGPGSRIYGLRFRV